MTPIQSRFLSRLHPVALCILAATVVLPLRSAFAQEMPDDPSYDEGQSSEPPYADDDYAFTDSTTSLTVDVLANDFGFSAPIDPTTVTILDPTETGTATVDPLTGQIAFTPDPGEAAIDYLLYEVRDENGQVSNPAYLWIDVMHDPPYAEDDFAMTTYTDGVSIDTLSNDFSGTAPIDPASLTIVTQPAHGSLSVNGATGAVTYVPDGQYSGSDWFEYIVTDTYGVESNVGRVNVDVFNFPPEITWFDAWADGYGNWVFEGQVQDEHPETCTVEFGGIISGTVTPDATGYFSKLISLPAGTTGMASATATDELGEQSNTADTFVHGDI